MATPTSQYMRCDNCGGRSTWHTYRLQTFENSWIEKRWFRGDLIHTTRRELWCYECSECKYCIFAQQPEESQALARQMMTDPDAKIRESLARNSETPADVLQHLAQSTEVNVLVAVAANARTPDDVLRNLVSRPDQDIEIRKAVALNIRSPADVFRTLMKDSDPGVRVAVASNQSTPLDIVRQLLQDENPAVRLEAVRKAL